MAFHRQHYYMILVLLLLICRVSNSKTTATTTAFTTTSPTSAAALPSHHRVVQRLFIQQTQQDLLERPRGSTYDNNITSTIQSAQDVASIVGVKPPASNASVQKWKYAYKLQKYITPILHIFDPYKPPNSNLNVYCMWWKALSGNDIKSPVYDNQLSYDLLPHVTRRIITWFAPYFPRLHHANVEIRTAFLDQVITNCVIEERNKSSKDTVRIRLITFGAGYDIRSIKLKERGIIDEAIELDLPHVIDAKERLLSSQRFQKRRPLTIQNHLPKKFYKVDLNNITLVETILDDIISIQTDDDGVRYYNILVFEAVMIYLNDGIPHTLLQTCSNTLRKNNIDGSLCFADRLENIPSGNYTMAVQEMISTGWNLIQWLPKPGLARHMGRAKILERFS